MLFIYDLAKKIVDHVISRLEIIPNLENTIVGKKYKNVYFTKKNVSCVQMWSES